MHIKISWYGRCCFLVEMNHKKILFDPYDRFCNVDIGIIDADILISSSTWHDHGHIGASPQAHIITYPGVEEHFGFTITGIEAMENRGTPTVVFNVRNDDISITNFADLGAKQDKEFDKSLSCENRAILASTNIAFTRPSIGGEEISDNNIHNETFLKYCKPNIIFPEHFFPQSFIAEHVPKERMGSFLKPNIIVDEMAQAVGYPEKFIDDFVFVGSAGEIKQARYLCRFLRIHPLVRYVQ